MLVSNVLAARQSCSKHEKEMKMNYIELGKCIRNIFHLSQKGSLLQRIMGLNMGSFPQVKDTDVEGYMRGSRKVRKEMACTYDVKNVDCALIT